VLGPIALHCRAIFVFGQVHPISSLTGENTANLMRSVYENLVQQMQVEFPPEPDARFRESTGTLINPQETGDDQE
jgi:GTP-binding protein